MAVAILAAGAGFVAGRYRAQTQWAGLGALQAERDHWQSQWRLAVQQQQVGAVQQEALAAERAEAARLLGQLQSQAVREAQDAAFFRAIATGTRFGPVTIQRLRIQAMAAPRQFRLTLVLSRPIGPETPLVGKGTLTLDGNLGGKPANIPLARLTADKSSEWAYNYRHLQTIAVVVGLPAGFVPDRVTVELAPQRGGGGGVRQSFLWQTGPL